MGIRFTHAEHDKVIARMVVRPDLCTLGHTIHGGSAMAFADTRGGAATLINLPADAKGTTTIESKTNFVGAAKEGLDRDSHRCASSSRTPNTGLANAIGNRRGKTRGVGHPDTT